MNRSSFFAGAIIVMAVLVQACGSGNQSEAEKTASPAVAETPAPAPAPFDPDPTDTIPGDAYPAYGSDTAVAALIRKTLLETEKEMANVIPAEQRKFKYHAFDLNEDGKNELMVALYTPFYCGTGGCTAYLLNADGSVNSKFSVVRFPVYVAASSTKGWHDLMMYSGSKHRWVKWDGSKYPSNPSTLPEVKGDIPNMAPALLNIWEGGAYPAFSY